MSGGIEGAGLARRRCVAACLAVVTLSARLLARRDTLRIHSSRAAKVAGGAWLRQANGNVTCVQLDEVVLRDDGGFAEKAQAGILAARVQPSPRYEEAERRWHHIAHQPRILDGAVDAGLARK